LARVSIREYVSGERKIGGMSIAEWSGLYIASVFAVFVVDQAIHQSSVWWAGVLVAGALRATYVFGRDRKDLR
jgi:hypothetical protein